MNKPLYFCTYFDSNYVARGLALYRSLERHVSAFRLWVLCLDDSVYEVLRKLALPRMALITLSELESGDEALLHAKSDRNRAEYYFTCTPSLILHILSNYSEVDMISYVDADLFFFSNPSPLYDEFRAGSILIVAHRFPERLRKLEVYGIYNVGLLCFQKDEAAFACLHWWRERCLEWCYDRVEDGRFADQKYLDDWPTRFRGVVVLQHKGAGLAPWNLANYRLEAGNGQLTVDSQPLVFFHFHGLRRIGRWLYDPALLRFGVHVTTRIKQMYDTYVQELRKVNQWLSEVVDLPHVHEIPRGRTVSASVFRRAAKAFRDDLALVMRLLRGQLLVVIEDKVT